MDRWALIMASATPVSSEGGTSILARAERGVRGFQHDAEPPQVADAVIEACCCIILTLPANCVRPLSHLPPPSERSNFRANHATRACVQTGETAGGVLRP